MNKTHAEELLSRAFNNIYVKEVKASYLEELLELMVQKVDDLEFEVKELKEKTSVP